MDIDSKEVERLDIIVSRLCSFSREYAKHIIENGDVFVDGKRKLKPGEKIKVSSDVAVHAEKMKYVGRGGYKLEKALCEFNISLINKTCIDVGASTGGFTDCMLQNGASKVFAVDTGSSQLADSLLRNDKVISMEKTKIQDVDMFTDSIDFIAADVSFVSLTKIIGHISFLLYKNGEAVLLIKPQFEAGKSLVGKNGVVKNPKIHKKVIFTIYDCMKAHEINPAGLTYSSIKGQEGNIEYLIYGCKKGDAMDKSSFDSAIEEVVRNAFIYTKY